MLKTPSKKTGRPIAVFKSASGTRVPGLMRLKDGRWRASGPEKYTFSEPNEDLAVAHFRQWEQRQQGGNLGTLQVHGNAMDALSDMVSRTEEAGGGMQATIVSHGDGLSRVYAVADHTLRPEQWAWLRQQILARPLWVAQMVGIEQIGYLDDIAKPTISPTLEEVGKLYLAHAKISDNWRAKTVLFWREFVATVGVSKLRELTQEQVVEYSDVVRDSAQTPTYARQRFGAIKAVINYPTKRGKWAVDAKRALALCGVLVPPQKAATDPNPIPVDAFRALLEKASGQMRAALLTALNACMYGGEVAALDWSDLDLDKGTLVTSRNKTKVLRIAMLWPETVAALRELPRTGDAIFLTEVGTRADYLSIYRLFKSLRKSAAHGEVQFSQIRDGAYTAAVEAGVALDTCRMLAGHATGISDHYVKRRPSMVSEACEAIRSAYAIAAS